MDDYIKLRLLDIDDLTIMEMVDAGMTRAEIAQDLLVTMPAITQRVRKIEFVFGVKIARRRGRMKVITPDGTRLAQRCRMALNALREVKGSWKISLSKRHRNYVDK